MLQYLSRYEYPSDREQWIWQHDEDVSGLGLVGQDRMRMKVVQIDEG